MLTELSIPTWLWALHEDQPASPARGVNAHTLKRRGEAAADCLDAVPRSGLRRRSIITSAISPPGEPLDRVDLPRGRRRRVRRRLGTTASTSSSAFDALLHGSASRQLLVGRHARAVTSRGVFRPVALVDGRVAATWGLSGGVMSITLREPFCSAALDALIDDAADVLRFLGLPDRPPVVKGRWR
jgi:hypothetical protein